MKRTLLIALALASSIHGIAQNSVPSGTIIPLRLNSSLSSKKSKPGQAISARVMQDVPLPDASKIRAGAKVIGHVVAVQPETNTSGSMMSLQFDTLVVSRQSIPVVTNLRALASTMAVHDAQIPENGPDRGTSENSWTTDQIGGEVVYRGGGPVANGFRVVGTPAPNGVLVHISSRPGSECRGEIDGNDRLQALWVFSSDVCGVYDLPDVTLIHAGRTDPVGKITLSSKRGDLHLQAGSGMLLRINKTLHSETQ